MSKTDRPTVESEIKRLFPEGTRYKHRWHLPPHLPVDVFATVAHLLQESGAYQYIVAPFMVSGRAGTDFNYAGLTRAAKPKDVLGWQKLGQEWSRNRQLGEPGVLDLWRKLWKLRHKPLVGIPDQQDPRPAWWDIVYALLVVSDEASGAIGYTSGLKTARARNRWANDLAAYILESVTDRRIIPPNVAGSGGDHYSRHVALDSLSNVDRSVCRVLPKGRTTELGCILRTFSHNLALVGAHGQANAYWHQTLNDVDSSCGSRLKILAIPFPYKLATSAFRAMRNGSMKGRSWGRFRIDQTWLNPRAPDLKARMISTPKTRASFVAFVDALIEAEPNKAEPVNAILLPEYALDWETYDDLVRYVLAHRPNIEFLISGISKDCTKRLGNLVAFTTFVTDENSSTRVAYTHSRRKHHRWMIDHAQIKSYKLSSALDPNVVWWEYLEVEQRVLQMDVFRSGSTLTAVICEDLARVDPGLTLLRALGPNLIFALLMDGPQLKTRWPSVYAASLADDPGSSVLSFTSMALIERSNRTFHSTDQTVALWRNRPLDPKKPRKLDYTQLNLSNGSQALVINLMCASADEITLDGRTNNDATAWYLESYSDVTLPQDVIKARGWRWITG